MPTIWSETIVKSPRDLCDRACCVMHLYILFKRFNLLLFFVILRWAFIYYYVLCIYTAHFRSRLPIKCTSCYNLMEMTILWTEPLLEVNLYLCFRFTELSFTYTALKLLHRQSWIIKFLLPPVAIRGSCLHTISLCKCTNAWQKASKLSLVVGSCCRCFIIELYVHAYN